MRKIAFCSALFVTPSLYGAGVQCDYEIWSQLNLGTKSGSVYFDLKPEDISGAFLSIKGGNNGELQFALQNDNMGNIRQGIYGNSSLGSNLLAASSFYFDGQPHFLNYNANGQSISLSCRYGESPAVHEHELGLSGTWMSQCLRFGDSSVLRFKKMELQNPEEELYSYLQQTNFYWGSPDCQDQDRLTFSMTTAGSYNIGEAFAGMESIYNLKNIPIVSEIKIYDANFIAKANSEDLQANGFCGYYNWQVGFAKDVSGLTCSIAEAFSHTFYLNQPYYDIIGLTEGRIQFGQNPGLDESERAIALSDAPLKTLYLLNTADQ